MNAVKDDRWLNKQNAGKTFNSSGVDFSSIHREVQNRPEVKQRKQKRMIDDNPSLRQEVKEKISESIKRFWSVPENRQMMKDSSKRQTDATCFRRNKKKVK